MGKNIITQRRGRGTTSFRAPGFRFKGEAKVPFFKEETVGLVSDVIHCQAHTAPLAVIEYETGDVAMNIASEGVVVGQEIAVGGTEVKPGNTLIRYICAYRSSCPTGHHVDIPFKKAKDFP